jgi:hypothetical protein
MSNPTPQTPEVTPSVVVPDAIPVTIVEAPKAPGKVKTAFRHPIQTIKRHSVVSTALIASAVGAAAALLLTKDSDDVNGGDETTTSDDSDTPDNVISI